jgi:hypothetical protein
MFGAPAWSRGAATQYRNRTWLAVPPGDGDAEHEREREEKPGSKRGAEPGGWETGQQNGDGHFRRRKAPGQTTRDSIREAKDAETGDVCPTHDQLRGGSGGEYHRAHEVGNQSGHVHGGGASPDLSSGLMAGAG